MQLMATALRVQFAEVLHPWLEMREIVRIGGDSPSAELQGAPLVIDVKEKKQRLILEFRGFTFVQERARSIDESVDIVLGMTIKLSNASTLPPILNTRYEALFIEPYPMPFHELVIAMKEHYLRRGEVVDSATDIGLVFDQHEADLVKHTNIGPMSSEQLRSDYLFFPRDDVPEQFIFSRLGYEQNKQITFDINYLKDFLKLAVVWQTRQAKVVLNLLKKDGG